MEPDSGMFNLARRGEGGGGTFLYFPRWGIGSGDLHILSIAAPMVEPFVGDGA